MWWNFTFVRLLRQCSMAFSYVKEENNVISLWWVHYSLYSKLSTVCYHFGLGHLNKGPAEAWFCLVISLKTCTME